MKNKFSNWLFYLHKHLVYIGLVVLLFWVYVLLLPKTGGHHDIIVLADWCAFAFQNGIGNVYKGDTIYFPLFHFISFLFGKLQGSIEAIYHNINYFKLIPLVFDFIAGIYLIRYLNLQFNNIAKSVILSLFFFLNIAYFYNTLIWGQLDSINACLIFLAFFFAIKQRVFAALVSIFFGINFKFLSIIFLPFIGLILLPTMISRFSLKKLVAWIVILGLMQFLIILPFILTGELPKVGKVVANMVSDFPFVSFGAFNFWHWVIKGHTEWWGGILILDYTRIWEGIPGLTYKRLGLALFYASSFLALFPLLKSVWFCIFHKKSEYLSHEKLLLIAALIPFLLFFLCTEMHERNTHTGFIFLAAYSLSTGKWFPYLISSVAYLLNLEKIVKFWHLNYNVFIFKPSFIALLYFICIVFLFFQLYNIKLFHKKVLTYNSSRAGI